MPDVAPDISPVTSRESPRRVVDLAPPQAARCPFAARSQRVSPAAAMERALRSFVLDPSYPCVGARSVLQRGSFRHGVYDALGGEGATAALARDLAAFTRGADELRDPFASFIAIFEGPRDLDPHSFERALWSQLQALHDRDTAPWDPRVSADPGDSRFSFSFAGAAYFIIGLHPGSARLSRRFPWPALVFNPHAQFEQLRETGKYARMQQVIRDRDRALQGDINPALREFGSDSEARQYSGRPVEPDWRPPFHAHPPATPADTEPAAATTRDPEPADAQPAAASDAGSPAAASPVPERPRPGQRHRIPPHSGVAFRISRGQVLRVIDPTGRQVCDLYSVAQDDPREHLSSGRSIDYADTLYLTTGHVLYSNRERAMWTIGRDDVGRHDLVLTPCSPEMFRRLRGDDGTHPSCYENLRRPMSAFGVEADSIGSTFNIFMDVRFDPNSGKMTIAPPASAAGDAIELRAEVDMIVGLTACSSEVTNDGSLKPIDFEIVAG